MTAYRSATPATRVIPLCATLLAACGADPAVEIAAPGSDPAAPTNHLWGSADVAVATVLTSVSQTTQSAWSLSKTGALSGNTVTWAILATETPGTSGQLLIQGQLTVTNTGTGPATLGNVVVNLQTRVSNRWVTMSSNVANATDGDAATTAGIHTGASSEGLATFTENSASGSLSFMDASHTTVSLVSQVMIDAGETRALLFAAEFDNNVLGFAPGTNVRAEVIVSFGNATVNGNSTENVDINGNGAIDADEGRIRSVASRLGLTVPAPVNDNGAVILTDTEDDISTTGDVTFSNVVINLGGATSGTVTADVSGGTNGGSITNCAQLTGNSVDLQACRTVNVASEPPTCTPGAPGCGWVTGEMRTATQSVWGDAASTDGAVLQANFNSLYPGDLVVGGTNALRLTVSSAVFGFLPAAGTPGSLTGDVVDPLTTSAGEFAGVVVALQLNVDFLSIFGNAVDFGSLRICNLSSLPILNGQTVNQFLATANNLLGGGGAPFGASTATSVARLLNSAFALGIPSSFAQTNLVAGPSCGWSAGDLRTAGQSDWGGGSTTVTTLLGANFSTMYAGTGLVVGGTHTMTFDTPSDVVAYLPASGTAGVLAATLVNPLTSSAGELGGQVVALQLNVDYSSVFGNSVSLGTLRICNFTAVPSVNGQTVDQFLATVNWLLGGGGASIGPSTASAVASLINNAFVSGTPSTFAQNNLVTASTCPTN